MSHCGVPAVSADKSTRMEGNRSFSHAKNPGTPMVAVRAAGYPGTHTRGRRRDGRDRQPSALAGGPN